MSNEPDAPKPETVSQMYPDKWLHADDLKSRTIHIKITESIVESVYDQRAKKYRWRFIIGFGRSKRLILNKTQGEALWVITETEQHAEWIGHTVALSPAIASNKKQTIKISAPKKKIDETAVETASRIATSSDTAEEE